MNLKEIIDIVKGEVRCGDTDREISICCASDLMSDVLTLDTENALLITGLATNQAINTAQMADIETIIFVRGKKIGKDLIAFAEENDVTIITTSLSMFRCCGLLFDAGLKSPYPHENTN